MFQCGDLNSTGTLVPVGHVDKTRFLLRPLIQPEAPERVLLLGTAQSPREFIRPNRFDAEESPPCINLRDVAQRRIASSPYLLIAPIGIVRRGLHDGIEVERAGYDSTENLIGLIVQHFGDR